MNLDNKRYLDAMARSVATRSREGQPTKVVCLERTYPTHQADLWDAVTNPERLKLWFLPVEGELKLNGSYQIKGNAGGKILICNEPEHLALSWEFDGQLSWVDVRVEATDAGEAKLMLEHIAHESPFWTQYGPGAVGLGWDLALIGLEVHVLNKGPVGYTEEELVGSPEGKAFIKACAKAWGEAAIAGGEDEATSLEAAKNTADAYTGEAQE